MVLVVLSTLKVTIPSSFFEQAKKIAAEAVSKNIDLRSVFNIFVLIVMKVTIRCQVKD